MRDMETLVILITLTLFYGFNAETPPYRRPTTTVYQRPTTTAEYQRPSRKTTLKATTKKPVYKPDPYEELRHKEMLKDWDNPHPSLARKLNVTTEEYGFWSSLGKFVPTGEKARPNYVERFCQCRNPFVKRSLVTRVRRQVRNSEDHVVRREWRRMTKNMKKSFIKHFNNLSKLRANETKSRLNLLADWHRKIESPGAHRGPAFLPWHREYLYRLEMMLRDDGYKYGLPYWNSGLERGLPSPAHSAIFTTRELGVSNGTLGRPFRKYSVSTACIKSGKPEFVLRLAGKGENRNLINRNRLDGVWDADYQTFSKALELHHGVTHFFFGREAHMLSLNCVGFEPMFFLHHVYIDYLWEEYRRKQNTQKRENDYPTHANVKPAHLNYATMYPFDDKENIDGLKIQYTNVYYTYQKSPGSCTIDNDCRSPLLWCNNGQCQARVREFGDCNSQVRCYCKKGSPTCQTEANVCRCANFKE